MMNFSYIICYKYEAEYVINMGSIKINKHHQGDCCRNRAEWVAHFHSGEVKSSDSSTKDGGNNIKELHCWGVVLLILPLFYNKCRVRLP